MTLPPRHYELAAQILAAAVEEATHTDVPVGDIVTRVAADAGRGLRRGAEGGDVVLANCPFHTLARDHTALVCGMNLHLLTALLEPAGPAMQARLDPAPGRCCVVVGPA